VTTVQIELTAEQRAFVRRALETGRVRREEDAVKQALELWVEREREHEEILAALDVAEAELDRGEGTVITRDSMRQLAEEIHQRGLARMAKKKAKRD
jgi:Arc/MetJ-type ribon-helix-helix transcriptional regulator